jgi:signal peptidase I
MSAIHLTKKLVIKIIKSLPFVVTVIIGVPIVGMAMIEGSKLLGLRTIPVPVVGTGSMFPSLFWSKSEGGPEDESKKIIEEYRSTPHLYRRFDGISLAGTTYGKRIVGYGDMVAFRNDQTKTILAEDNKDPSAGFIKRIIGVPGDRIELRDGFVYRNDSLLEEPYLATPRSTYGGTTIADCQVVMLDKGTYLVLGDNRKVSSDSRFELGLVHENDIEYVLPYSEQKIYHSLWRDTSKDRDLLGDPTLSSSEFVTLVNAKRQSANLPNLIIKPALTKSTTLRGSNLLQNKNTPLTMKQAINSAGYSNIVLGEFVSHGHFSAKELLENLLYNTSTAKQILSSEYSDIGVSAVNQVINGCPTQVIVGHLGGYIPASYDEATIGSWRNLRDNLAETLPSWEQAQSYENINQAKLSELLTILRRRRDLATEIVKVMENREWLSDAQEARIKNDESDAGAAEVLTRELNGE